MMLDRETPKVVHGRSALLGVARCGLHLFYDPPQYHCEGEWLHSIQFYADGESAR